MPAEATKRFVWTPDAERALTDWIARAANLGINLEAQAGHGVSVSMAVRQAIKHATDCRCMETEAETREDPPFTFGAVVDEVVRKLEGANALASTRKAAGLSQAQAAARLGITRGALATAEARATCSVEYLERVRRAYGGAKS